MGSMKNRIGDSQLTNECLQCYKPLEIERDRLPLLPVSGAALRAVLGILSTRASACHSAMGRSACTSLSAVVLLLEILRNVMLHGSCVKARPRCARHQECYRGLTRL